MLKNRVGWVMAAGVMLLALAATGCREDVVSPAMADGLTLEQQDEDLAALAGAPMPCLRRLDCRLDRTAGQRREIRGVLRRERRALAAEGVRRGQALAKLLDLDEAQKSKVAALIDRRREALKGPREEFRAGRITRAQMRERVATGRQEFRAALRDVLTPEQNARLEGLVKERRSDCPQRAYGHRQGRGHGRGWR